MCPNFGGLGCSVLSFYGGRESEMGTEKLFSTGISGFKGESCSQVDDVIKMAWVDARILAGSNEVYIAVIG